MWIISAICIGVVLSFLVGLNKTRKRRRWEQAFDERSLMFSLLLELRQDPTMTDQNWVSWLPIFEYTDYNYQANNFENLELVSLAEMVRKNIKDKRFLQGV